MNLHAEAIDSKSILSASSNTLAFLLFYTNRAKKARVFTAYIMMIVAQTDIRRWKMFIANLVSYILVLLGALNWGLYGVFNFNLVSAVFMGDRSIGAIITYVIIALAAIWLIVSTIFARGFLRFTKYDY